MYKEKSHFKTFLTGAFIGAAAGAVAALLYTPKSGEKLRKELKKKGGKIKDNLDNALKTSQDIACNYREKLEHLATVADKVVHEVADEVGDKVADKKVDLEKVVEKVSMATKKIKKGKTSPTPDRAKKKMHFFKGI
ncbi:YtxH domain-containing protein [Patescibacteria group bacterium]|nr:YtxH domain-containing protein [Patescibacteria group bacterium]